jgi:guanylate kinase
MKKLRILCIFGPSGAGKTEIIKLLLAHFGKKLRFSISATTRDIDPSKEKHGIDYYFLTHEEFAQKEQSGEFIETNPFVNAQRYGTLRSELELAIENDQILVLDVEVNGAMKVYEQYPDETMCLYVYATEEEIVRRLSNASTRKRDKIPERVANLNYHNEMVALHGDKFVSHAYDTTGRPVEFWFNAIANKLVEESNFRASAVTY